MLSVEEGGRGFVECDYDSVNEPQIILILKFAKKISFNFNSILDLIMKMTTTVNSSCISLGFLGDM
jgi:hypothetical protein